jgi:hypothetical protein
MTAANVVQTSAGPLRRHEDWDLRLHAYFELKRRRKFRYGQQDCCRFAVFGVLAMTGVDLMEGVARYRTKEGAELAIQAIGGGDLEAAAEAIAQKFEMPEVPVAMAQRGDVVLMDTDRGPALGLVDFDGRHVLASGPLGLVRVAVADCRRAWRV